MDKSYIYFYGGDGRKYSVYISPDDGSCIKCPTPAGRGSMVWLIAALLVVLLAGTLNHLFQSILHQHPNIVIAMLLVAVLAGIITYLTSRHTKEKLIQKSGQPILKSEISNGHIALGRRQLKTDLRMILLLAAASLVCGVIFVLTCNVLLWLCCIAALVILASLAGSMELNARKQMYQWLTVYQAHPEWSCMLRFSGGYLTMTSKGRRFPDNNIQAVNLEGTVLWDIGTIQQEPVNQGYVQMERVENDTFRVRSVFEDDYLLQADIPSLTAVKSESTTE